MFCNYCGAENPDGSRFCSTCARPVTTRPPGRDPSASLDGASTIVGPPPPRASPDFLNDVSTMLAFPPGFVLKDRFEIRQDTGIGGMGRVYLAHDKILDRDTAIKVLREELSRDPRAVRLLVEEAKAAMRLAHPNILRMDDYHETGISKFLAMEYVKGETLHHRLGREGRLPEKEVRRIAVEVCLGLEHAHAKHVIHRDLKPENILLGEDGSIKIADFGIARVARDTMLQLTSVQASGTLVYMAPEQLDGTVSERSDMWSLGVVLYEILSGEPPFCEPLIYQIQKKSPAPLEGVSQEMNRIVLRCLEKDPGKRFANVRALRAALAGTSAEKAAGIRESARPEPVPAVSEKPRVMANSLGMEFVRIPAGKFMMGCSPGDSECDDNEKPAHEVRITRDFELQVTEVTQGQWQAVMGNNPSYFKGDDNRPVENVTWNDAHQFLEKLNSRADGYRYRLPTEAEWEYAARGGIAEKYYGPLDSIAWYDGNSGGKTHPAKAKQPNKYSLHDMLGNVWECCEDRYGEKYYESSPSADPKGPDLGHLRVLRGGSFHFTARYTRASNRGRNGPGLGYNNYGVGFRCARERIP